MDAAHAVYLGWYGMVIGGCFYSFYRLFKNDGLIGKTYGLSR